MITGAQLRQGRNLVGWAQTRLAFTARVPLSSLIRAEGVDGQPAISEVEGSALERALSTAGVEFLADEGQEPSARLRGR